MPEFTGPRLVFPLEEVLAAAEYTAAVHEPDHGRTTAQPGLWWIKYTGSSSGTYLKSNAPIARDTTVVYAHGYGPGTDTHSLLGAGRTWRETIPLHQPLPQPRFEGSSFLTVLREAAARGEGLLVLQLAGDHTEYRLTTVP
ncbi:hypothetical protein AB0B04_18845 [Streptomyces xinghaiensis]|uniref:DUF3085 domain-containing protein n=2 Tax=Streptomyces TaxID=1883 RepID=A0A3R7IZQ8_9ACTN|nr:MULTISPECIES: hypothetical protein [Streptomyces]KNE81390.1 hypothetical protein ADZ36_16550 [Streptomyces fradiae]OFA48271.1 hypothetical protein BEN35_19215 [Streptomyces fradiae]PQM20660.1 hypothetical protein Sfr7A_26100 [Streptomyces xinghaiensis]RKM92600.1 hypothetical protein SFRA_024755 [Streptomyces xinghaiensis]RNC70568.1 hypothetical protein DC095_025745 [Streptomyces xinghaiensis]